LQIDADMLKRPVNVGFSGGEKKPHEILQMAMLEVPEMCILDETDFGSGRGSDEAGVRIGGGWARGGGGGFFWGKKPPPAPPPPCATRALFPCYHATYQAALNRYQT